ncbi:hypothetical protein ACFQRK_22850 [Parapedobacter sp. GCM10030251]|uniref:hypothetical protein n=1 Tax=Parapedobacter sp. GCM10030251 TaxID=3273419 RepID=UPI003605C270
MDENEDLGRYLQKKLRDKGIEDKAVADALNISLRSVRNIYPLKDIYAERLAKFCVLLDEDLFLQYYGQNEPLKSILNREKTALDQEVTRLRELNEEKERMVSFLKEELEEKEEYIKNLQSELGFKIDEILTLLKSR